MPKRNQVIILLFFIIGMVVLGTVPLMPQEAQAQDSSRGNLPPEVAITSPDNTATVSGIVSINGTASDDVNVTKVQIHISAVKYNATDTSGNSSWATWSYSLNTSNYEDGWLSIAAIAYDGSLASDTHIKLFIKNNQSDNIDPNVWFTAPANNTEVSGWIAIKGHATDNGPIKYVDLVLAEKEYALYDASGNGSWYKWVLEFNTSTLKNGKYWVTARAHDGKNTGSAKILIIINNSAPQENHWPYIEITYPKNEATVSGVITITGKAWDVDGSIVSVQVIINHIKYNATDISGNGSWYHWKYIFNTSTVEDGGLHIGALAKDNGSKLGDAGIWVLVKNAKENMAPHVTITQPANEATVSGVITIKGKAWDVDGSIVKVQVRIFEVYYNATDISGNGTWYYWKLDFNTTKLKDDEYKVTALATDNGSKLADAGIWILVKNHKENMAPHIEITQPANEATVSGVITIKGKAWDKDGSITNVQVRIGEHKYNATDISGNGTWYNWKLEFNTSNLKDGEYKIGALATDNASKLSDTHIWILVKNHKENHWPYVNITHPKNEATVSGWITISGSAWDVDGNITKVKVRINDVWYNATDDTANGSWYYWSLKFNTSTLKDGEYKIVALAYDDGNKLGDAGRWMIVKNHKESHNKSPRIDITHPHNEATVSGVIVIKGKAWDPDGKITKVKIKIFDKWYDAKDTSHNDSWYYWELEFDTKNLKNGWYKITAAAYDGMLWEDDHIFLKVANERENPCPKVAITSPKAHSTVHGKVFIRGTAWDDKKVVSVQVKIGEHKFNAVDTSKKGNWATWRYKWNTKEYENGEYRLGVIVFDGHCYEDTSIVVFLNDTSKEKGNKDGDKGSHGKDKKEKPHFLPGFEAPSVLVAAAVAALVVSFFRSGGSRNRTK